MENDPTQTYPSKPSETPSWGLAGEIAKYTAVIAIIAFSIYYLRKKLHDITWEQIWTGIREIPPSQLALAVLFTAVNFVVLTGYDFIAVRYLKKNLSLPKSWSAPLLVTPEQHLWLDDRWYGRTISTLHQLGLQANRCYRPHFDIVCHLLARNVSLGRDRLCLFAGPSSRPISGDAPYFAGALRIYLPLRGFGLSGRDPAGSEAVKDWEPRVFFSAV